MKEGFTQLSERDGPMSAPVRYSVREIPTMLLFTDEQVAGEIAGAMPKDEIIRVFDGHSE